MRPALFALAPVFLGLLVSTGRAQMEEAPVPPIDRTSRQAVIDAYRRYYLTSAPPPIEWTGSVNPVNPGTTSLAFRKATLQRINWYRRMAGNLPNIVFDPQLNAKCQAGALMISAAGMFTPKPPTVIPTTWPAYTPEGVTGVRNSSLALNVNGPQAIDGYVADLEELGVGHRLGLLEPARILSGTGDVQGNGSYGDANNLWNGEGAPAVIPLVSAWPPSGYVPIVGVDSMQWPRRWSYLYQDGNPQTGGGLASISLKKNGVPIPISVVVTGSLWEVSDAPSHGDVYQVTIENFFISGVPTTVSYDVLPIDPNASKLINVSTRLRVEAGENVGIAGFVVAGDQPRRIVVRAIGPSLSQFGVSGALANPILELRDGSGSLIASNDDWTPEDFEPENSLAQTLRPGDPREAAIVATVPTGSYTAVVRGQGSAMGIALIEVYDLHPENVESSAVNVSTRGRVQDGEAAMIGGFVVNGAKPTRVIVRALGPSLISNGVQGALADPILEIRSSSGDLVASCDNVDPGDLAALGNLYPSDAREAAVVLLLNPGAYTAIVKGSGGSIGVALVEVYQK